MSGFELLALGGGAMGSAMSAVSAAVGLAGTAMSAMGTIAAGKAQAAQAQAAARQQRFQAKQYVARGKWERAQKRREADIALRRKNILLSKAQAQGASSGFLFGDHTSSINIANLERYGSFDEFAALAGGEMMQKENQMFADSKMYEASISEMEASAARSSGTTSAMGTLLGGVGTAFSRFNPQSSATQSNYGSSWKAKTTPSSHVFAYA